MGKSPSLDIGAFLTSSQSEHWYISFLPHFGINKKTRVLLCWPSCDPFSSCSLDDHRTSVRWTLYLNKDYSASRMTWKETTLRIKIQSRILVIVVTSKLASGLGITEGGECAEIGLHVHPAIKSLFNLVASYIGNVLHRVSIFGTWQEPITVKTSRRWEC